jgi:hypothetical protein
VALGAATATLFTAILPVPNMGLIALATITLWRLLLTWVRQRRRRA